MDIRLQEAVDQAVFTAMRSVQPGDPAELTDAKIRDAVAETVARAMREGGGAPAASAVDLEAQRFIEKEQEAEDIRVMESLGVGSRGAQAVARRYR